MATATATAERPRARRRPARVEPTLAMSVRLPDGRETEREYPASRHREIHLGFLHRESRGFVELAAGHRDSRGELAIYTRRHPDHFLAGGATGGPDWPAPLTALASHHHEQGQELFVGVAPRSERRAGKEFVHYSRWAWVDVDEPDHAGQVRRLLAGKPAHIEIESGGSDPGEPERRHLYWLLSRPLYARTITDPEGRVIRNPAEVRQPTSETGRTRLVGYRDLDTGEVITDRPPVHWIERTNRRLIHALGVLHREGERVHLADRQCAERARVLRLAGSINGKTGRYARIARLDLWLPAYSPEVLVGDLCDPPSARPERRSVPHRLKYDAYKLIPPEVYFKRLAGIDLPARGNINCPSASHEDLVASCSVGRYGWRCHGCGAGWSGVDLTSALEGGPTGDELAASPEAFKKAKQDFRRAMGEVI